jgi:hypothetical protein
MKNKRRFSKVQCRTSANDPGPGIGSGVNITGGQRDAVIRKLEAFVVTSHDLVKRTCAIPSFLTPENIELIAGFEKSVLRVESSLRDTTRP